MHYGITYRSFTLLSRTHQVAPVLVVSLTIVDREYFKLQHGCGRTLDAKLKKKQVRITGTGRGLRVEWGRGGERERIVVCHQQYISIIGSQSINITV